jgi:ketosteroid isomerase-like protein
MKIDMLVDWYQRLSPSSLSRIGEIYHETASFQDPFNHVQGQGRIAAVFQHMFDTTDDPTFTVEEVQVDGKVAWVSWVFNCGLRSRKISIEGVSQLMFSKDGRVIRHRDYWDTTDLYQQLPLLGRMFHMLKRRFKVPHQYPVTGKLSHGC